MNRMINIWKEEKKRNEFDNHVDIKGFELLIIVIWNLEVEEEDDQARDSTGRCPALLLPLPALDSACLPR